MQPTTTDALEAYKSQAYKSRLDDVRTLAALSQVTGEDLGELVEEDSELLAKGSALGVEFPEHDGTSQDISDRDADDVRESATTVLHEYPLWASAQTVFKVDICTGGPGEWLEVKCNELDGTPVDLGRRFEVERVSFHYAWSGTYERYELTGDELANVEAVLGYWIPELAE